jgi:glutathione synthase/RimK-type ligase-like ATP-grasp enzyme
LKILCLTSSEDISTQRAVAQEVQRLGATFQVEHLDSISINYTLSNSEEGLVNFSFGSFCYGDKKPLSIWHRRCEFMSSTTFNKLITKKFTDKNSQKFFKSEYGSLVSNLYKLLGDCYWINSPKANTAASGKIKNIEVAGKLGLKVPPTIVSNSSEKIYEFAEKYSAELLLKPFNSFEIYSDNKLFHCVARKISIQDIKSNTNSLSLAPVFLQRYIDKKFELRVIVVGAKVFSIAIFSQEHEKAIEDWRCAPLNELRYAIYQLPQGIEKSLIDFNLFFGLEFSVFDMIVSKEDEIYFLECNPDGEWYWLEIATGACISKAIAERLIYGGMVN